MFQIGNIYFYFCGALAIAGALTTISQKSPIRGAMGLLLMIVSIAGLFLALHAQFLAAIQLIVYAGAIVVLFLFVIMLLGPSASTPPDTRGRIPRAIGAGLFGLIGIGAVVLLFRTAAKPPGGTTPLLPTPPSDFGSVDTFGRILFKDGLVPFELSSALLMVAIVGAVAVARGRTKHELPQQTGEGLSADDVPIATAEGAPRSPGGLTREA
jgi:NADH-quinone oxidoreductase subunit J